MDFGNIRAKPNGRDGDQPARNKSANNVYSISSTVTGTEIESASRIAEMIRQE
jgi:hypothetical protein